MLDRAYAEFGSFMQTNLFKSLSQKDQDLYTASYNDIGEAVKNGTTAIVPPPGITGHVYTKGQEVGDNFKALFEPFAGPQKAAALSGAERGAIEDAIKALSSTDDFSDFAFVVREIVEGIAEEHHINGYYHRLKMSAYKLELGAETYSTSAFYPDAAYTVAISPAVSGVEFKNLRAEEVTTNNVRKLEYPIQCDNGNNTITIRSGSTKASPGDVIEVRVTVDHDLKGVPPTMTGILYITIPQDA